MSARSIQEWWTPAALAELRLVDMPGTVQKINDMADTREWRRTGQEFPANPKGTWRQRDGRGGGFEYRIDVLPIRAQAELTLRLARDLAEPRPVQDSRHAERWAWFDAQPERKKAKARAKFDALTAVAAMTMAGSEHDLAMQFVAPRADVSLRTLYNWQSEVRGVAKGDWLPHLAPRSFGSVKRSECCEAAWDWYKTQYLRQEKPSHAESYRLLKEVAGAQGWTVPSAKTLERRIEELPKATIAFYREGPEHLKRLFPAQERDRSVFHALEAVNADGHTWDVFVTWWDGTILRPSMVAFQDLHSGKILSWRFDKAPNKDIVRLAFLDVVDGFGVPEHCVLDNGRDFASKWITGGTPTRYRFKVRDEEPLGILPSLGITVHWTQPYRGQAKPIERAFRDFCMSIAKHPVFAGAWTGNTVAAKPENYGSKAVPIADFSHAAPDFGVVVGGTGIGKTTAIEEYQKRNSNVFIWTAEPSLGSINNMLSGIADEMEVTQRQASRISRSIVARVKGAGALIVVDEAQHLQTAALDQLRTVQDKGRCGGVVVGNESLLARLKGGTRRTTTCSRSFTAGSACV